MCLEAIWGYNIQTLNCVGYDHNWVRGYNYTDDSAPLLPKGTILHIIGYMDNSPSNKNVPDPRNWQGSGNRSVANMFIDLGNRVALTDEQFQEEMAKRREQLNLTKNDIVIGCPLCSVVATPAATTDPEPAAVTAAAAVRAADGAHCRHLQIDSTHAVAIVLVLGARARRRAGDRGAQSLSLHQAARTSSPAYEGWEAGRRRHEVLPVRLHEPELGRRDRRAGRPRQQVHARRRRSGAADALPAAPQPLRVPRQGAGRLHREGRTDLDADDARQDREGVRTLRPDYKVDDVVKASETGALGAGTSSPESARATSRRSVQDRGSRRRARVKVGQPVTLVSDVTDDGIPKRRAAGLAALQCGRGRGDPAHRRPGRWPRSRGNPRDVRRRRASRSARTSACTCRGSSTAAGRRTVTFDPPQIKAWEDTRAGANSPWAPIWTPPDDARRRQVSPVQATFSEPGTYVLRCARRRRRADGRPAT